MAMILRTPQPVRWRAACTETSRGGTPWDLETCTRTRFRRLRDTCTGRQRNEAANWDFNGTVGTEAEKNAIWDAIKTIPTWQKDIVADIKVTGAAPPIPGATPAADSGKTYTVKAGDTLSKIAKDHLGSANAYMKIFDLNKDRLSDPDQIKPGQVLRLP